MVAYKYVVHSDADENNIYDEFDTQAEAVAYAKEHADSMTYVDKIEVEINDFGEVVDEYGKERIWSYLDESAAKCEEHKPDSWGQAKADIEKFFEKEDKEDAQHAPKLDADDVDGIVEALEENESEVECKGCFELFPKESCVKTAHGYMCKGCAAMSESLEGTVDADLADDRTPHQEEPAELGEPFVANEMRKHEHAIKEGCSEFEDFYIDDWTENDIEEACMPKHEADELHEEEQDDFGIEDEARIAAYFRDLGEGLEEHVQDRPAPVEDDTELEGMDNAVVDCQTDHKVIAHCEDEKPLDCLMKKPPLEKPLTEAWQKITLPFDDRADLDMAIDYLDHLGIFEEHLELDGVFADDDDDYVYAYASCDSAYFSGDDYREYDWFDDDAGEDFIEDLEREYYKRFEEAAAKHGWTEAMDTKRLYHDKSLVRYYAIPGMRFELDTGIATEMVDVRSTEGGGEATVRISIVLRGKKPKLEAVGGDRAKLRLAEDDEEPLNESQSQEIGNTYKKLSKLYGVDMEELVYGDDGFMKSCYPEGFPDFAGDVIYSDKYWDEFEKWLKDAKNIVLKEDVQPNLEEAKKEDDELPVDPEAVKLEVHQELNDLVADEIEAINGYDEAKADIMDAPIEHKDAILDTIDHIKGEEKEHIDELIDATNEIPFGKEAEDKAVEAEDEAAETEEPFDQDFPDVEEKLEENADEPQSSDGVKAGDKIRILHLDGEGDSYDGKEGVVEYVDGIGQLHGTWGGLAVIPGVDSFVIVADECLEEEKAKPEGDKEASYDKGLKLAKLHNKPVIYGYENKTLNGKFFALDDPIVCDDDVKVEEDKFRAQYKNCGVVYVAYPDKDFIR